MDITAEEILIFFNRFNFQYSKFNCYVFYKGPRLIDLYIYIHTISVCKLLESILN